ncbi:MAG: group III truncated hemoglobin [Sulfurimonas sp.]|uniref:group III truncated hemoglobin n=1 Tax=Sulfurimonas sp. TaxID=2022749 RepID=UPI00260D8AB3|nr:group III truncated hemoglobin [Sulfurimonas sp.]MCW8894856.1 group III truncated hemoglobin [Sulfurimonas sp.]MCW8953849.1 group III truncated hemoglobin [Sulfurimonas sp.]MCW9067683.1 group III truncated hemoglobin [Sulfurimonas sp.]
MLANEITKANLRTMVISFYTKVLEDELVGPFFIDKLGPNLGGQTWGEHLDILTDFWASIYLSDMAYRGSPFAPHLELDGLKRETFERWLKLFFETVDTVYELDIAEQFKNRGTLIAGNFMRNLGL